MKALGWLALLAVPSLAAPAWASSVPPVDLAPNETAVEFGLFDVNLDHAFGDRLAAGLNVSYIQDTAGARATYRLGGTPGAASWGVTLGAGYSSAKLMQTLGYPMPCIANDPYCGEPPPDWLWLSPALVGSVVWRLRSEQIPFLPDLALRGTLGPAMTFSVDTRRGGFAYDFGFQLVPSLEIGFLLGGKTEFLLGGNALEGQRTRFGGEAP